VTKRASTTSPRIKRGVAIAFAALAVGYVTGLWSDPGGWVDGVWHLLAASTIVPNWLLGLFAICAIIVAGWLGASLRPRRDKRRGSPIASQDTFFNVRWRWSYDTSGSVVDPTPYCLRCGSRLVLNQVGSDDTADRYECRCESCGTVACEIDCSLEEFEGRVLHRIHQVTGG